MLGSRHFAPSARGDRHDEREHPRQGQSACGIPFNGSPNGFWVVAGLIAAVFALVAIVLYRFRFKFF